MIFQEQVAIIIPSLNPDERMLHLIKNLKESGFQKILVVNDGSRGEYNTLYHQAAEDYGCKVIEHAVNLGKGRALKSAFNYILTHWNDVVGAVTADSDGQHQIDDILKCAQDLVKNPDCLIMGCRDFSQNHIPFRSKAGNIITCKVLSMLCGISVADTQTGLRGLPRNLMESALPVEGERFEYEMNMLVSTKEKKIDIVEVPIQTIYLNNNQSSHFSPLVDSLKIYAIFSKFLIMALSSFVIDISLFTIFNLLLKDISSDYHIIISTVIARFISSIYNFIQNKNKVFHNKEGNKKTAIRYYILCIVQMYASATGVNSLYHLIGMNESVIKMFVDLFLFMLSFQIQMRWVFKDKN
ncbi:dolichol-phosphate mannosyltransferase [Mobilisporobacter senegalensis]|uniref:Dolichol-phosphate mannosyltransferase n=1 Tax=Mobilisporobacter senegalensis TaxID=1329262 RepID=A0A3N1XPZ1_9FIRM|nr:bifunctional glycosyltransferase family 2/GtrA family protein [Mobilisporobacter senegalensis]ROR28725.1 dolichol-phosphate mannosyltransferase [Mobilisporobacter senegalensis]